PQCRCWLKLLFRNLKIQAINCLSGISVMNQFTEKNVYATSGTEVPRYRKFLNRAYCSIQIPQLSVMILFFHLSSLIFHHFCRDANISTNCQFVDLIEIPQKSVKSQKRGPPRDDGAAPPCRVAVSLSLPLVVLLVSACDGSRWFFARPHAFLRAKARYNGSQVV
ncbi:MAG: hypothetical protein IJK98_05725, partial [Clostridia bacterium]|nr:hypothetical protein [Clostridia bacterium]